MFKYTPSLFQLKYGSYMPQDLILMSGEKSITAEQMIEAQRLYNEANFEPLFWVALLGMDLIIKGSPSLYKLFILMQANENDTEADIQFQKNIIRGMIFITIVSIIIGSLISKYLFSFTSQTDRKIIEIINTLFHEKKENKDFIDTLNKTNLSYDEVENLLNEFRNSLSTKIAVKDFTQYIGLVLAFFGFLEMTVDSKHLERFPAYTKGNQSIFFLEATKWFIYLLSKPYQSYYIQPKALKCSEKNNLLLNSISFQTTEWKLHKRPFHYFSLTFQNSKHKINIQIRNQNETEFYNLPVKIYTRELAGFLLRNGFNLLYFNDAHLIVTDWGQFPISINDQQKQAFMSRLKIWGEEEKNTPKKLNQLNKLTENLHMNVQLKWKWLRTYNQEHLPEVCFFLKLPLLSQDEMKVIHDFINTLRVHYPNQVNFENNVITVQGLERKWIEEKKPVKTSSQQTIFEIEDNKTKKGIKPLTKEQRAKQKEESKPISNKQNIIIQNMVRPKELDPDEISKQLDEQFSGYTFKPLFVKGRTRGTTYSKVDLVAIDNVLQKDEKNYTNNRERVDACLRVLSNGQVKSNGSHHKDKSKKNAVVPTNEICMKGIPIQTQQATNNNNNNQVSNSYTSSFFKAKHANDRLFATQEEEIVIDVNQGKSNTPSPEKLTIYHFNYLRLGVHS